MDIHWYPGHMTKAKREIEDSLKMVDAVIELLDARIPKSSRNPDIDSMCKKKPRIVLLNKSDLSDDKVNSLWVKFFKESNLPCLEVNSLSGKGIKEIPQVLQLMFKDRNEKLRAKGIISKPIRILIAGIPNVGKSSLINRLSGRASAKTGDKPGVTRGKQWIKLGNNLELLDTPGILWPKFEDSEVGLNLAFTGAIKDEIIDIEELSLNLISRLKETAPDSLKLRYKIANMDLEPHDILKEIGKSRGCMLQGGEIDTEKASNILIDEFRSGKLGKISLERP